ncbi:MAG: hypothetical protein LQ340_001737 [Diploschistes diacapsis]|nr:MAG: hypothetical protein LQ340_001737 [Diploschistes diacapsis]
MAARWTMRSLLKQQTGRSPSQHLLRRWMFELLPQEQVPPGELCAGNMFRHGSILPKSLRSLNRSPRFRPVRRRFSPVETSTVDSTILAFRLHPTDPDFPFELEYLDCILQVPTLYPDTALPTLNVRNKEMERGFQVNVEQGFSSIVKASPRSSLLSYLNALDRRLEPLLSGHKAETIKFVANARKSDDTHHSAMVNRDMQVEKAQESLPQRPVGTAYSPEQRVAATSRREVETRQLEARLGRQPMFAKSSDGVAYTLPVEPRRRLDLPVPIQSVKSLRLFVPMLYPLLPCRIALQGVARDAALPTERAFEKRAQESPETTLTGHINFLATNMHTFAAEDVGFDDSQDANSELEFQNLDLQDEDVAEHPGPRQAPDADQDDRAHLHVVSRPPEWAFTAGKDSDSESDDFNDEELSSEENEEAAKPANEGPERGISIDFPNLEIFGIELLELTSLSLIAKCTRCKESTDVNNLRHETTSPRQESCKKCASVLTLDRWSSMGKALSVARSMGCRRKDDQLT